MRTFSRSFSGGEVTPELFGRIDDTRFQTGLAKAQNYITLPHGPARKRPGSEFIAATRYGGAGKTRGMAFVFSATQSLYIECSATAVAGEGRFRFYNQGVPVMVLDSGTPAAYVPNKTFTDLSIAGSVITFASSHAFEHGYPVYVTLDTGAFGSELPATGSGPFRAGTIFYVRKVSSVAVSLTATQADALAGTNILPLDQLATLFAGPQSYRLNYAYQPGDIVEGTPAGAPGNHYCITNPSNNVATSTAYAQRTPGTAAFWYALPVSGILEIPHPYLDTELPGLRYWTSNDVITILHRNRAPSELRRYATARWAFVPIAFAPALATPSGVAVAITSGTGNPLGNVNSANPLGVVFNYAPGLVNGDGLYGRINFASGTLPLGFYRAVDISTNGRDCRVVQVNGSDIDVSALGAFVSGSFSIVPLYSDLTNSYKVSAVDEFGGETPPSAAVTSAANNLNAEGAYNTITWGAVTGAKRYNIYRLSNGLYGLIGTVESSVLTFKDDNLPVALDKTPPILDTTLNGANPEAGCYHEQRRVFARDQSVWMTRVGTESDLTYKIPTRDDDRVSFTIASTERCPIQHMWSLGDAMLALTDTTEYAIVSPDGVVITPASVMPRPQAYVGASPVRPIAVGNVVLYAAASGGHVRAISYQASAQGFFSADVSLRATHLFDTFSITSLANCRAPYSIAWATSSSGKLLGFTFIPDQDVAGWHQHTFGGDGFVEDCTAVRENGEERLYLVVRRTINGTLTRYIERLAAMRSTTQFLDCHKVSTNVAAGVVSGYSHLAGATVRVLADGIVMAEQTVSASGQIVLPAAKSTYQNVTVGLTIDAQLQSLPLVLQTEGFGQGDRKNVSNVWVRLDNSAPCMLGPSVSALAPSHSDAPSVRGILAAETLRSESVKVRIPGTWGDTGQIVVTSTTPLPSTVVCFTFEFSTG